MDYGYNFMNTKIFFDNESTVGKVKNLVFHSKTKHIEIRHHFIRDSNEKKLIQMIKIHTDQNVADLLTKAFDVGRFRYLIATEYAQMMLETTADDAIQVSTVGLTYYWYALIENPTIYVSLIQQFWNTATAKTLDNREMEITATIDGKVKIVSEASIRRYLKLEYSDGISNLPTTEIFKQLALMGSKKTAWEQFSSNIATTIICLATNRTFNFFKMIFDGMGEGSTVPVESHHTFTSAPSTSQPPSSSPSKRTTRQEYAIPQPRFPTQTNVADEAASTGVDVRHGGAATTVTSLDAGQGSGNIDKTPTMPHDSPLLRVHILRSDEGSIKHNEIDGFGYKIVRQSCSFRDRIAADKESLWYCFYKAYQKEVCIAEKGVSTVELVSTAGALVSTVGASSAKDKGKAIIEESETIQTKTKLQLEQERLGYEEALRLQAEIDEEERQRIARRKRYFATQRAKERRNKPLTQAQQRTYMSQYIKNMGSHTLKYLKSYSFDEIKNLFETTIRIVHTFVPIESESERVIPKLAAGSSKRDAEEELVQESPKRLKTRESSVPAEEPKNKEEEELSQERIQ
ncbi:hypothetical protein Tco_0189502 [Tanacetum coccineum]